MKINEKILSIPPYISTSWSRIAALHMKGNLLLITLADGESVNIPGLNTETLHLIFQYHATYLEKEQTFQDQDLEKIKGIIGQVDEPTFRLTFGSSLEGLGPMMQHNPSQADAPDLPPEILQKIGAIAKIIGSSGELLLPTAEPNCNCFHCQIARILNPTSSSISIPESENEIEVSDKDLQFEQWTIIQTSEKLFLVVNRLDEHEKYNVYLGHPVGCTCGKEGCEHILAVLKS